MFLTYEMTVKSKYTIIDFVVLNKGITLYIKIEAKYNKMHRLEQMYSQKF